MSYELNKKIRDLVPYEPICGSYDIRLDANESPYNFSEELLSEVLQSVSKTAFNRYPDPLAGELVASFAGYYGIKPELVTAGNGSDELIFLIESAFLEKGDRMLVVSPDFSMYNFYSSICEVECDTFIKDESLNIDIDSMIKKINSDDIKLVIFSNPCNPTGQGVTREQARRLVLETKALIILDEAYMDFWDQSLLDEVEDYSNLIIFRTASKAVGSAALRLGFAVSNPTISRAVKAVKSPYNVNSISQAIGSVLYKKKEYLQNIKKTIVKNREKLYNELVEAVNNNDDFTVYPSCANFVLVKTSVAMQLWEYLKSKSIAIRYMGDCVRITAGTPNETEQTIKYIKKFLQGDR